MEKSKILVFKSADQEFAFEIDPVREVRPSVPINTLPDSMPFIEGMVHLRGHPVVMINFAKRLNMKRVENKAEIKSKFIIVKIKGMIMGFVVDQVMEVIEVSKDSFSSNLGEMALAQRDFIEGLFDLAGRMIYLINLEKILTVSEAEKVRLAKIEEKTKLKGEN